MYKTINIQRAFNTVFGDRRNIFSVLIGAAIWVLALVAKEQPPLGLLANLLLMGLVAGFCVRVIQQELRAGASTELPHWSHPEFYGSGLRLAVIENIYNALILLGAVAVMHQFGSQFSFDLFSAPILKIDANASAVTMPWIIMVMGALFSVYASLFLHLMPVHYAATGESFRTGFAFASINRVLFHSLPEVLIAVVLGTVFMLAIALLSQYAAPLTPLLFFMQQLVMANIWAQVYKVSAERIAGASKLSKFRF